MAPEEVERTFTVGSVTYVLRRNDAELDLDIAPSHMQAAAAPSPKARTHTATVERKKPVPVFRIIVGIVVTGVLAVAVRWGARYVTYMNVPWRSYTHPDRMFRVNFAGIPEKSSNVAGTLRTMQLESSFEGHFYIVEFIQFLELAPVEEEMRVTDQIFDAIVRGDKWTTLNRERSNRGLNFIAEVPKSEDWSLGTA